MKHKPEYYVILLILVMVLVTMYFNKNEIEAMVPVGIQYYNATHHSGSNSGGGGGGGSSACSIS